MTIQIKLDKIETEELIKNLEKESITKWKYSKANSNTFKDSFKINLGEEYLIECSQTFATLCSYGNYPVEHYIRVYDKLGNYICDSFDRLIPEFYNSIKLKFEENEISREAKVEETHKKKFDKFTNFLCKK